ncbi:MAG: glucosidase, partial [Chitinophagaceae bacterium]|nr:glucosidase [Chitinophagaceae bacterium]
MNAEQKRLKDPLWKTWGPYVSNRQWGTVREDYSNNGDAWNFITHDMARSKAYRWGEEGIAGISDNKQLLCFSLALWNKKDPIIKEIFYGLSNQEGNHGEDVKELFYYLDNTPTHSYMKMLYKYPQQAFPYTQLIDENKRRSRKETEFELVDTGIFNDDKYFDVFIEYAKATPSDILIKIEVHNRGNEAAALHILPAIWFRNTWLADTNAYKPSLLYVEENAIEINHTDLDIQHLYFDGLPETLFCENETNTNRLYGFNGQHTFFKDGINNYLVNNQQTINPDRSGTKAAVNYEVTIEAHASHTIRLRLTHTTKAGFADFDQVFATRQQEAEMFYNDLHKKKFTGDEKLVFRQALA